MSGDSRFGFDGGRPHAWPLPCIRLRRRKACSALPVAYTGLARQRWSRFAPLVLEAAYEATLLAGLLNARRGGSNIVLLTHLGGGAFGNDPKWIDAAMRRALALLRGQDLDVRVVSYGAPVPAARGSFSS